MRTRGTANARTVEPDQASAVSYYERVRSAFARACELGDHREHRVEIAGTSVCLRFAGRGLASLVLTALSPRLLPGGMSKGIEVEVWDQATTGVGIPEPPWSLRQVIARGDVRSLSGGRIRAQVDTGNKVLTMWDTAARRGLMWAPDADRLPYWVRAAPLRAILHWALAREGRHLLHAAAVGSERSGALLVGPSGSGKSTTSLACLQDGLGYVADDYVLVETLSAPRAVGLYATAKLGTASRSLLPELAPVMHGENEAKFTLNVAQARPEAFRRSVPISAILLPRVASGTLSLRQVTAAQALRALAPSTILQHSEESAGGMAVMSALVRRVPAYALDLGSDITAVAPAIRKLLDSNA